MISVIEYEFRYNISSSEKHICCVLQNVDAQNELLKVIETNATLEELVLENSGIKG